MKNSKYTIEDGSNYLKKDFKHQKPLFRSLIASNVVFITTLSLNREGVDLFVPFPSGLFKTLSCLFDQLNTQFETKLSARGEGTIKLLAHLCVAAAAAQNRKHLQC